MSTKIYYAGQSLDLTLAVVMDNSLVVEDATEKVIQYKTPSGAKGEFEAEVSGDNLTYSVEAGTLLEVGKHYFWVHLKFAGNKEFYGTPVTVELFAPGTPVTA